MPTQSPLGRSFVPTLLDYEAYFEVGREDTRVYAEVREVLNQSRVASGVYADRQAERFRFWGGAGILRPFGLRRGDGGS